MTFSHDCHQNSYKNAPPNSCNILQFQIYLYLHKKSTKGQDIAKYLERFSAEGKDLWDFHVFFESLKDYSEITKSNTGRSEILPDNFICTGLYSLLCNLH